MYHDVQDALVVTPDAVELGGELFQEGLDRDRSARDGSRADSRRVSDPRPHRRAVRRAPLDPAAVVLAIADARVLGLGDVRDAVGGDELAHEPVALEQNVRGVHQEHALDGRAVDEELLDVRAVREEARDDDGRVRGLGGVEEADDDAVRRRPDAPPIAPSRALRRGQEDERVDGGVGVVLAVGEDQGEQRVGVADVGLGREHDGPRRVGGEHLERGRGARVVLRGPRARRTQKRRRRRTPERREREEEEERAPRRGRAEARPRHGARGCEGRTLLLEGDETADERGGARATTSSVPHRRTGPTAEREGAFSEHTV